MKRLVSIAAVVAATATGCSTRVAYDSAQNWQRLECQKMQDATARTKCLADAGLPYDDYKRQSESPRSSK